MPELDCMQVSVLRRVTRVESGAQAQVLRYLPLRTQFPGPSLYPKLYPDPVLNPHLINPHPDQLDPSLRLYPRHDDSPENVLERLKLSDVHMPALRAAYSDVSVRVSGKQPVAASFAAVHAFLALEAGKPHLEVLESWRLKEMCYELVETLRWASGPRVSCSGLMVSNTLSDWDGETGQVMIV